MSATDAAGLVVLFVLLRIIEGLVEGVIKTWRTERSGAKRHERERWAQLLTISSNTSIEIGELQAKIDGWRESAALRAAEMLESSQPQPIMISLADVPKGKIACEHCGGYHLVKDENCPRIISRTERFEYRDNAVDMTGAPRPLLVEVSWTYDRDIGADLWTYVHFAGEPEPAEPPTNGTVDEKIIDFRADGVN